MNTEQTDYAIKEYRFNYFLVLVKRWRKIGICPTRADFTADNGDVYADAIREFNLFCDRKYPENTAAILKIK